MLKVKVLKPGHVLLLHNRLKYKMMFLALDFLPWGISSPDHLEITGDSSLYCKMEILLPACGEMWGTGGGRWCSENLGFLLPKVLL